LKNVQSVAEYATDIFKHMYQEEKRLAYPKNFLDNQTEIDRKKRSYLVDYLIEVHYKFKMWPETLYVTVGLVDRYLMKKKNLSKKHLQTLGITAIHIAGKYEEIYPPSLDKLVKVTQCNLQTQEVIKMEMDILSQLDFDLIWPSPYRFLERFIKILQLNNEFFFIAQYFVEYALLDKTLVSMPPSKIAAIGLLAASKVLKKEKGLWSSSIVKSSGYSESEL